MGDGMRILLPANDEPGMATASFELLNSYLRSISLLAKNARIAAESTRNSALRRSLKDLEVRATEICLTVEKLGCGR
jgi:hypothetical protein